LEWARPGDLLVLAVHQDRRAVLELLNGLTEDAWKAGEPLPLRFQPTPPSLGHGTEF
jgi:hypothetical protein